MRIVVANPWTQWPVARGTDRLILNLLDGLSVDHDVVLVTMADSADELVRLDAIETRGVSVRGMLAPNRRSVLHRILYKIWNGGLFPLTGVPPSVRYAAPEPYLRSIADTAHEWAADVVLANYWHLYRLPDYLDGPKPVIITHDLDFLVNPGRLDSIRGGPARLIATARARSLERIERKAYGRYDTILTVTASDAEVLAGHPLAAGKTVLPLPLALDLSVFKPGDYEREANTILFLGTLFSDFNRDALLFFMKEVFPLVLEKNPDATLQVVGYGVDETLREAAGKGVVFTGGVKDIRPYMGRCSLMVLPLRFCGGVRIRLMEAAAMGTPVVSTPIGVAGMGVEPGRDYYQATSADEMARGAIDLLEDNEQAAALGKHLRLWAENNISMENYPARLNHLLAMLGDNATKSKPPMSL